MSEKKVKHASDLICITHILKTNSCFDITCDGYDDTDYINCRPCPLNDKSPCGFNGSSPTYTETINDWMEKNKKKIILIISLIYKKL